MLTEFLRLFLMEFPLLVSYYFDKFKKKGKLREFRSKNIFIL